MTSDKVAVSAPAMTSQVVLLGSSLLSTTDAERVTSVPCITVMASVGVTTIFGSKLSSTESKAPRMRSQSTSKPVATTSAVPAAPSGTSTAATPSPPSSAPTSDWSASE